jgi:predicted GIY-YIG superfamily endonuclease
MGRRSFISMTAINRLISASNAYKREQERTALINSQRGNEKELPPHYDISRVDFNINSRITKIEILQTQQYRTIDRYVTQNYVKYPIYSDWKLRSKVIKKSIKLTNNELENLYRNRDDLIREFAKDIILAINNPDLLPSWFINEAYLEEYREIIEELNSHFKAYCDEKNKLINRCNSLIKQNETDLTTFKETLSRKNKQLAKLNNKINKIESANKNPFKYIFSFFIYAYLISSKRKNKLNNKRISFETTIKTLEQNIKNNIIDTQNQKNEITIIQNEIAEKETELKKQTEREHYLLGKKQKEVTPLPTEILQDTSFVPLKSFVGMEYQKIIGCYIIRNKENKKCYVGQSKDVLKRIRQHFKGTIPNNVIFAEDYYCALSEIRDNLFEIKIIPCETKDELDRTEKQLIEDYDAFNNGYNGTSGNT